MSTHHHTQAGGLAHVNRPTDPFTRTFTYTIHDPYKSCRERLRKTKGTGAQLGGAEEDEDEEEGGRLPLGRQGQPLSLDVDAPTEVRFVFGVSFGGACVCLLDSGRFESD
jgi:hypothetical protein